MAPPKKEFLFSNHYREDKDIDVELTINCIQAGKKEKEREENKFRARKKFKRGELIVVYRDYGEYYFVITAFWNKRGEKR